MPNAVPMFIKIVPLCGYFLKINTLKPLLVLFLFYSDLLVQVTRLNVFLILELLHVFTLPKAHFHVPNGYWVAFILNRKLIPDIR